MDRPTSDGDCGLFCPPFPFGNADSNDRPHCSDAPACDDGRRLHGALAVELVSVPAAASSHRFPLRAIPFVDRRAAVVALIGSQGFGYLAVVIAGNRSNISNAAARPDRESPWLIGRVWLSGPSFAIQLSLRIGRASVCGIRALFAVKVDLQVRWA